MAGPGSTAQSGFYFQNSVAALFIGEMIGKPNPQKSHHVTKVTNEAIGETIEVDDILVIYADGHRCFIQVKENIDTNPNSKKWKSILTIFVFIETLFKRAHYPFFLQLLHPLCIISST